MTGGGGGVRNDDAPPPRSNNSSETSNHAASSTNIPRQHGRSRGPSSNSNIMQSESNSKEDGNDDLLRSVLRRQHPQQQITLTCYIPPNKVGAVIGRGGKTILGVQREAGRRGNGSVRMSVGLPKDEEQVTDGQLDSNESDLWTPVTIRGNPIPCFEAAKFLLPLVDNEMDDVVLDIPIHKNRHAAIIGRKGLTIAALSADHGVRIMVPSSYHKHIDQPLFNSFNNNEESTFSKRRENIVQLEGKLEPVEKCLAKMLLVVSPQHSDSSNTLTETTIIAPQRSSQPSLTKLRQIGKKTGTVIRRKRIELKTEDAPPQQEDTPLPDDEENDAASSKSLTSPPSPSFQTQYLISGKTESVEHATNVIQKFFSSTCSDSSDQEPSTEKHSKSSQPISNLSGTNSGRGGMSNSKKNYVKTKSSGQRSGRGRGKNR